MARSRFLDAHRAWEDWAGIGLGVLIVLSPWLARESDERPIVINASLIGVAVLVLAEIELVKLRRWPEGGALACGLWLAASPFLFGYSGAGALRFWHFALGAAVALLALLELWQDRKLGEGEPDKRGE